MRLLLAYGETGSGELRGGGRTFSGGKLGERPRACARVCVYIFCKTCARVRAPARSSTPGGLRQRAALAASCEVDK